MTPSGSGYLWCAAAGLASAVATLCIKLSSQPTAGWSIARISWLGAAVLTYMAGFAAYSLALRKLDMNLAYPMMTGVAMAMVAALGFAALGEQLTASRAAGMLLVAAGAFLLSR